MEPLDKNSLLYWFPKIGNLGISVPKTEIILLNDEEKKYYEQLDESFFNTSLGDRILSVVENGFTFPVFMRTDQYSGKHSWERTCYITSRFSLKRNLREIIAQSRMADIFGLPLEAIVVREFIPMETHFLAFKDMPVNPERRYFIKEGSVLCHHPYWVEKAVEKGTPSGKLPSDWRALAEKINFESEEEIRLLGDYSERVAKVIPGFWSVDFCKAKDGRWILIDMAEGDKSWHPSSCLYSTMPEESGDEGFEGDDVDWLIEKDN